MAIARLKFRLHLLAIAPISSGIAFVSTSLATVQAQTLSSTTVQSSAQLPKEIAQFSDSTPIPAEAFVDASQHAAVFPESANFIAVINNTQPSSQAIAVSSEALKNKQIQLTEPKQNLSSTPVPGTTTTNATTLSAQPSAAVNPPIVQTDTLDVAQLPLDPGSRTRGGSSYVGIGGNIGLSGDTALGDGNFTIISKIGLSRSLALRPGVVLGNDPIFLIPITYEFSIRRAEALETALPIAPYLGAGVTIATGGEDNDDIGLLLTGGIDVPLNRQFTANAALNVGIASDTDIGLSVGVGYNFSGFGL